MIKTENLINSQDISNILSDLSPGKRLKYIRQKVINKNQNDFCLDGLIRSGTLKSIESERMKIGEKIAEKICHKLLLEGIECSTSLFINEVDECNFKFNTSNNEIVGNSLLKLEEIKNKFNNLTPVELKDSSFAPTIPNGSILLVSDVENQNLATLKDCLCFIKGSESGLYSLTYIKDTEIIAKNSNSSYTFSTSILALCKVYKVEIIYLNYR